MTWPTVHHPGGIDFNTYPHTHAVTTAPSHTLPYPMRSLLLTSCALLLSASAIALHDDDPKILSRKLPVNGPIWRNSPSLTQGGGSTTTNMPGAGFDSQGVTLQAWFPLNQIDNASSGNDCWGYTSPSGREYGIMGTSNGTAFFEVTNPSATQLIDWVDGNDSLWRDVKVYGNVAYSVTEGSGGIQVISMANIDNGTVSLVNTIDDVSTANSHNVVIDEVSGYLYRCGGGSNGLRMYSLANPTSPQYVGSWNTRYVHDAQIVTYTTGPHAGRQIAYCCAGLSGGSGDTGLTIVDVTNKSNPTVISQVYWPNRAYSHQGWMSEDRQLFYMGDELDENGVLPTTTYVINVADPDNAFYMNSFTNGNLAITHNCYTKGGLLYAANYTSGLRIFDLNQSATNPPEIGYFDTYQNGDGASFNGLWSVFPYFASGTVIGSDLEGGFFVWDVGDADLVLTVAGGAPEMVAPSGATIDVEITENVLGALDPATTKLFFDVGIGMQSVPLQAIGGTTWRAALPTGICGTTVDWYLAADSTSGQTYSTPTTAPTTVYTSVFGYGETLIASLDMETNAGWTGGIPGDTASTGVWERGNPNGTAAQPEDDHTNPGTSCWFTGQGSVGGSLGANDVDGGYTTLRSSNFDVSTLSDPKISFWLWYSNTTGGSPGADTFRVALSNNGGVSWVTALTVGPSGAGTSGGWEKYSLRMGDHLTITNQLRVRFVAEDAGSGSIVEAAVDDFTIGDVDCTAPGLGVRYCSPNVSNSTGTPATINATGSNVATDNNLTMTATNLPPNQFGYFLVSASQGLIVGPGGAMGNLCLGSPIGRFSNNVINSGPFGTIALGINLTSLPAPPTFNHTVQAGETWNFQGWYRDVVIGMPTSNFTDGISVLFQ